MGTRLDQEALRRDVIFGRIEFREPSRAVDAPGFLTVVYEFFDFLQSILQRP